MSRDVLKIQIDNKDAWLIYDTNTWTLSCQLDNANTTEFCINMDNIKRVYKSDGFKQTHFEEKNKLARTIIGGALFGATGAIIGAVSGEGNKEVVDAKYSCIHIETNDDMEYVIVCKETAVINSSWVFITNLNDAILSKNDKSYQKRKTFGTVFGIICIAIIIAAIVICNIDV